MRSDAVAPGGASMLATSPPKGRSRVDILRSQRQAGAMLLTPAVLAIILVAILPLLLAVGAVILCRPAKGAASSAAH